MIFQTWSKSSTSKTKFICSYFKNSSKRNGPRMFAYFSMSSATCDASIHVILASFSVHASPAYANFKVVQCVPVLLK